MSVYQHKKIRSRRIVAMTLRGLASLFRVWPLLLVAVVIVSPIGPHMRLEYTYIEHGQVRQMIACSYVGSRGVVQYVHLGECPFFIILDSRLHPSTTKRNAA